MSAHLGPVHVVVIRFCPITTTELNALAQPSSYSL